MEIFLRDPDFKKIAYLDEFESFIWTERFNEYGDFEMSLPEGSRSGWLQRGSYITHADSHRVMMIEERHEDVDNDGKKTIVVKGRSIEAFLDSRVVVPNYTPGITWRMSGTMGEIVTRLVGDICYRGIGISDLDIIPGLYVVNDVVLDTEQVSVAVKIKSLYEAVKELCESSNLGFAINQIDNANGSRSLRFFVYEGKDRSNVIFGSLLNNLTNTSNVEIDTDYKNVAYVWAKDGTYRTVAARKGGGDSFEGMSRRALMVDANDIVSAEVGADKILDVLRQRGREALVEHQRHEAFDGEITPDSKYRYNADYGLGDIVNFRDARGVNHKMKVSEQIWSVDSNGEKRYPTFTSTTL